MNIAKDQPGIEYRAATPADAEELTRLFWEHITANTSYISHGEMQMGVALDGGTLAGNGREKWKAYIESLLCAEDCRVWVSLHGQAVTGFGIVLIDVDEDKPFGVLNDILVRADYRHKGIGSTLLARSIGWLKEQGIGNCYLESGRDNHAAHDFFVKQGFHPVSKTFHLSINHQTPL